jgi:hypothetical protein
VHLKQLIDRILCVVGLDTNIDSIPIFVLLRISALKETNIRVFSWLSLPEDCHELASNLEYFVILRTSVHSLSMVFMFEYLC